jgi:hypothetical protein
MIEKKCGMCDYWLQIPDRKNGICRRYPPTLSIQLIPKQSRSVIGGNRRVDLEPINLVNWPSTTKDDFCGEFANEQS